ncbi:MAG: flagellar protein [Lachnospiraceae bacterium]|nr:flagellar protein [Lachnospiraceae bacterium]
MNVKNCKRCNKIFEAAFGFETICPACKEAEEEEYKRVKDFVWDHPGVTINEVAEICDVDPKMIKEWLREERLSLINSSGGELKCELCGTFISAGRYCPKCKDKMIHQMREVTEKPKLTGVVNDQKHSEDEKMRFLGRRKK